MARLLRQMESKGAFWQMSALSAICVSHTNEDKNVGRRLSVLKGRNWAFIGFLAFFVFSPEMAKSQNGIPHTCTDIRALYKAGGQEQLWSWSKRVTNPQWQFILKCIFRNV